MYDSRGAALKVGDRVLVEAEVTSVQEGDAGGYCNVTVKTVTPQQANPPAMGPSSLTLNTRMLTKVGACLLLAVLCLVPSAAFADCPGGLCRVVTAPARLVAPALRVAAAPVRFVKAGVERRQARREARRDARRGS